MRGDIARWKSALRAQVLAGRDALASEARAFASVRIQQRVLALEAFERAQVVMAYCSFGSEIDTSRFIAAVYAQGKTLVLPRVNPQRRALEIHVVRDPPAELVVNGWGIREPDPELCGYAALPELDFVLAPGLAFDVHGRLGYGKGYYDRFFHACRDAGTRPFVVAGAFEAQIVTRVPMEPHDVAMTYIATEARAITVVGAPPLPE